MSKYREVVDELERYCDSQVDPSFYARVYERARWWAWITVGAVLGIATVIREIAQ